MINKVPEELKVEFLIKHPDAKVLEYREVDGEILYLKTIYWEYGNLLGIYSKNRYKSIEHEYVDDSYMTVGNIDKLISLSKFYK